MYSVADDLWISGLPDEQRAIVERYADRTAVRRSDFGRDIEGLLRAKYEEGYRAGAADTRAGIGRGTQLELPGEAA